MMELVTTENTWIVKLILFAATLFMGVLIFMSFAKDHRDNTEVTHTVAKPPIEAVGMWRMEMPGGASYFTLAEGGKGVQSLAGTDNKQGRWEEFEGAIYAYWNDGWTDVLRPEQTGYVLDSYPPGIDLDEAPVTTIAIEKVGSRFLQVTPSRTWGHWVIQQECTEGCLPQSA